MVASLWNVAARSSAVACWVESSSIQDRGEKSRDATVRCDISFKGKKRLPPFGRFGIAYIAGGTDSGIKNQ